MIYIKCVNWKLDIWTANFSSFSFFALGLRITCLLFLILLLSHYLGWVCSFLVFQKLSSLLQFLSITDNSFEVKPVLPANYYCNLMEEPGRLQSMGSLRVGHDWATSLSLFTFMHWRRKWQPIQCSCLENPRDGGAWSSLGSHSQTWLKWLSSSISSNLRWFSQR